MAYLCNVDETCIAESRGSAFENYEKTREFATKHNRQCLKICGVLEEEASKLQNETEILEYLDVVGLKPEHIGLSQVIKAAQEYLDLECFYSIGPKQATSWQISKGSTAVEAASKIHSDISKGFIKAEVMKAKDFIALGGEAGVKAAGKASVEGKDYIVHDGDIIHFKFN